MLYLTVDYRKEAIRRFVQYHALKENLIDVNAQLEVCRERNTNTRTKAAAEVKGSTGGSYINPAITISMLDDNLSQQRIAYIMQIKDCDKAFRIMSERQKETLELRYIKNYSIEKVAETLNVSINTVKRYTNTALDIIVNTMTKI